MKLKLCNNGLSVVGQNENGMYVSYSIEADEYKQWLSEGNIPEPEFTEEEIQEQEQSQFRAERNQLLIEADIEINKLDDLNMDSSSWRAYRQALRNSTENLVLPTKPEGAK